MFRTTETAFVSAVPADLFRYPGQNCSPARALEIVGERWTLLIILDAFLGLRRFDHFQQSLGLPATC